MRSEERKNRMLSRFTRNALKFSGAGLAMRRCSIQIRFLIFLWVISLKTYAQPTVNFTYKTLGLENSDENVIRNSAHLDDFFESLYRLKTLNDRKINIVHIGDSHIQADFLTNIVRRHFQQDFGNAGRGLIVPGRIAGTNEPFNIKTTSATKWNVKRCVNPDLPLPIGIGGITINTNQANAQLSIYMNDLWIDYAFNRVTLFFQKDISSFHFSIKDSVDRELAFVGSFTEEPFVNYSRVLLPQSVTAITIETFKSAPAQNQATLFGVSLENSRNGILYHSIGVNGARYEHYNAAMYFTKQTAALMPDLFIISLGTNEAVGYPYLDKNFYQHIDKFISSLRSVNPGAKFILVTPPDAYRKKVKHNPGINQIREQIIQYAVENGLAFWDMYKVGGGDHAADNWKKAGLLRPDGIHFTKDGYEYQASLLYHALTKTYNEYVSLRHP
jgi:lysophospholipase L1-like esterase